MQYISQDLINLIRAIFFGLAVGYAFFYVILYSKPIVEEISGFKRIDVDLWWMLNVTIAVVAGMIATLLLM